MGRALGACQIGNPAELLVYPFPITAAPVYTRAATFRSVRAETKCGDCDAQSAHPPGGERAVNAKGGIMLRVWDFVGIFSRR
jgi:hypothetical protein